MTFMATTDTLPHMEEELRERAQEVDERLAEGYADVYAGLVLKDQMTAIEVYLTDLEFRARREASEIADGVPIHFSRVLNPLTRLHEVLERVTREYEVVRSEGINLVVYGVDIKLNRVHLQVDGLTLEQADRLSERFGANYVYVYPGRGAVAAPASRSRQDSRHSHPV
jgi:hypothetical protein